ncbi:thioredoxin-like protein [Cryptosporidium ubiquitum]|uniref:Thioredoxin-like protein n=1 Tax=Cryptosporidium ubiquitum TaxID=857276 RepID=A0A1J4MJX2_9CRYT|nr:thioredoxin-like protein [Cryptosporidium ubiquitum]OII73316.1 thioredoxin-like protein [Cryptosporidium ubiquitum]
MFKALNSFVGITDFVLGNCFSVIFMLSGKEEIDASFIELEKILQESFSNIKFGKILPSGLNEISAIKQFDVKELPSILLFTCESLKPYKLISGYNPSELHSSLEELTKIQNLNIPSKNEKFKILTNFKSLMVFMKGIKEEPYCKFSKGLVSLFDSINVKNYGHYNIFENEETRQGLKEYHNWPTFPQICINGEFIGGLDILNEMYSNGNLVNEIPKDAF